MHLICVPGWQRSLNASQRFTVVWKIRAIVHVAGRSAIRINREKKVTLCSLPECEERTSTGVPWYRGGWTYRKRKQGSVVQTYVFVEMSTDCVQDRNNGCFGFLFAIHTSSLTPPHRHTKTEGNLTTSSRTRWFFDGSALISWRKYETPGEKTRLSAFKPMPLKSTCEVVYSWEQTHP